MAWYWTLFLLSGVLPSLSIQGFAVPLQYLALPLFGGIFLFVFFGWLKLPAKAKPFVFLWLGICVEVFLSGVFGPLYNLDRFVFPRELLQYVARFLAFLGFIWLGYTGRIVPASFLRCFLCMLSLAMIIGFLQFLPWPGRFSLVKAYTYSEIHLESGTRTILFSTRIPGIAGTATINGGLAAFSFMVAFAIWMTTKQYRTLCWSTMWLSVSNTIFSQARAGYSTIGISFFIFYLIQIYLYRKVWKPTLYLLTVIGSIAFIVLCLYWTDNIFILKAFDRWERLVGQLETGGNRLEHIQNVVNHVDSFYTLFFGISNIVRSEWHLLIDVDFANVFLISGVFGIVLQYGLIMLLLQYLLAQLSFLFSNQALLALTVASFVGLLGYQIAALAIPFWRDLYIGLFPWILLGVTIGIIERFRRQSLYA